VTRSFAIAMSVLSLLTAVPAWAGCESLHPSVKMYLQINPEWAIVELKDLEAEDQDLWQTHRHNQCPGMAVAKLDSSGTRSYALALLRHEEGNIFEKLVIISAGKSRTLEAAEKVGNPRVVWRAPPGIYVDSFSNRMTHVSHDAVMYEQLEAWAIANYLSHGKFRSIQTSD
jgi:hypothetical protein